MTPRARPRPADEFLVGETDTTVAHLEGLEGPGDLIEAVVEAWQRWADHMWQDLPADDEAIRAQGLRYTLRYLVAGASMAMEADPAYPRFVRFADATCSWGINNPDGNYLFAVFDPRGTYRISGDLGTAHMFDMEVHGPSFCEAPQYEKVASVKGEDLARRPDGTVEIILSADEHDGNWLRLTPDTGSQSMLVRQFFADWENERPASLAIERLDLPYPPPPLDLGTVTARTNQLRRWLVQAGDFWHRMLRLSVDPGPNSMFFLTQTASEWGGHQGQAYGQGNWRIRPDEAAILEIDPPQNDYFMVQLADRYWDSLDWDRRQTSLNTHQMTLDRDGVFRAVIALEDPGVANWLDPAGNPWGTIMGRIVNPDRPTEAQITVVPVSEVRDHLPAGTAEVSAAERTASLRRRSVAAQRRQHP